MRDDNAMPAAGNFVATTDSGHACHLPDLLRFFGAFSPRTLAGLSRIDRLRRSPMLAVMQRHVCLNGALRRHEVAPRASKARPGKVGKKVAAWVVERTS